jgi:hypothetical protein
MKPFAPTHERFSSAASSCAFSEQPPQNSLCPGLIEENDIRSMAGFFQAIRAQSKAANAFQGNNYGRLSNLAKDRNLGNHRSHRNIHRLGNDQLFPPFLAINQMKGRSFRAPPRKLAPFAGSNGAQSTLSGLTRLGRAFILALALPRCLMLQISHRPSFHLVCRTKMIEL